MASPKRAPPRKEEVADYLAQRPLVPLLPYQRAWLADGSRQKVGMWSRQIGKTFAVTLEAVLDCMRAEAVGRRAKWVILSRGERQAREAMEDGVHNHLAAFKVGFQNLEIDFDPNTKQLESVLPGGSRIIALPANPDTARGYSANVILDEFGVHKDSVEIWRSMYPIVSRGGLKLRVVSTPKGRKNKFYELMTGADADWSRHRCDIHQAVAQGLDRDIDALRRGMKDPQGWRQEYELEFLDEASAWLPHDMITAVEHDQAGDPTRYRGGPCFAGEDIANSPTGNLWTLAIFEMVGDVLWLRELQAERGLKFREQNTRRASAFKRYRIAQYWMDKTGVGAPQVEYAQDKHGSAIVSGIWFTPANKQMLAAHGKKRFEDRTLRINAEEELRADLHSLKQISTGGTTRFAADDGDDGSHADRAWAIFLACSAASLPQGNWDEFVSQAAAAVTPEPGRMSNRPVPPTAAGPASWREF